MPKSEMDVKKNNKIVAQSAESIDKIRQVCRLAREVLDIAGRAARPGTSTDEIDRIVHEACIERESYPSPLNYHKFPKSCCTCWLINLQIGQ
jgi:methionyl aminopeptidase